MLVNKRELLALQAKVQAYAPGCTMVASDSAALVAHGLMDYVVCAHFDVSATLFETVLQTHKGHVATIDCQRVIKICHELNLREGVFLGQEVVDGIHVYTLEGMRVRYEHQGKGTGVGSAAARIWAGDIARHQAKLAEPKPEPVAKPEPAKPTWGELNEAETVFEQRCSRADWYYSYIDNLAQYKSAKAKCDELEAEAARLGGNYTLIFKYHSTR